MKSIRTHLLALLAVFAAAGTAHAACVWCIPGASVEMDFEHDRYYNASRSDLTNTNSTGGWAVTKSGNVRKFSPNTLRLTDYGLLTERDLANIALWSRDLTKSVWVKTNMLAATAPIGADGTTARGTRLTATANNAKILQTVTATSEDLAGASSGEYHLLLSIKRVTGNGTIMFTTGGTSFRYDASSFLTTSKYTQMSVRLPGAPTTIFGIQMGTAGDVIDVDMVEYDVENRRGIIAAHSPFPTTNVRLTRAADVVAVNTGSNLYQALASASGMVYVKTFNCVADNPVFYKFKPKFGDHKLGAQGGSAPRGAYQISVRDGTTKLLTTIDSQKQANTAWTTIGDAYVVQPFSISHKGSTVRTVATWGGGQGSIVSNNGPVVTGPATNSYATGSLYIGTDPSVPTDLKACGGYIADIAFIPNVAADKGASLTVGPTGPPPPN